MPNIRNKGSSLGCGTRSLASQVSILQLCISAWPGPAACTSRHLPFIWIDSATALRCEWHLEHTHIACSCFYKSTWQYLSLFFCSADICEIPRSRTASTSSSRLASSASLSLIRRRLRVPSFSDALSSHCSLSLSAHRRRHGRLFPSSFRSRIWQSP